ncbi:MAG: hypothetical protein QXI19_07595 [Candidatus Caldarchaeum sp.]
MAVEVTTNNIPRPLHYAEDDEFFVYKGKEYYLSEFERTSIPGWDAQHPWTYFSGVVIRFVDEGESVVVGRYFAG